MPSGVEPFDIVELNNDQRRELVNARQRFSAWRSATERATSYRGSLVWHDIKGREYLVRAYYNSAGVRRQKTEGPRSPATEAMKSDWDAGRRSAQTQRTALGEVLERQAAVNRALQLGRVPLTAAKVLRALDAAGTLGKGIRVAGTNAIHAYEAAAGVLVDASITATVDIDLLWDDRRRLRIMLDPDVDEAGLIGILKKADASFVRQRRSFSAANRDGYSVDLIRVESKPTWKPPARSLSARNDDLEAVSIAGLAWLQNSPPFESIAIDERGHPVRIVTIDPRIFAIHKLWLSAQPNRDPLKRRRDEAQARVVAHIVSRFLIDLPYAAPELRMIPLDLFEAARPLFMA